VQQHSLLKQQPEPQHSVQQLTVDAWAVMRGTNSPERPIARRRIRRLPILPEALLG
jgi:hypothetical protein